MVKEDNTLREKKADTKLKVAQLQINALNVGKVLDQNINTEKVDFDTKLDAQIFLVEVPQSPADQVKEALCSVKQKMPY